MFTNIVPNSEKLKSYVDSFTVSLKDGNFPLSYTAFPNLGNCLAFFNHTAIQIQPQGVAFRKDDDQKPAIILLGRLTCPTFVIFHTRVEEISINFKPCGINYFFGIPFSKMANQSHQLLNEPIWVDFIAVLFSEPPEKRIAMLETFLLSKLNEHKADPLDRIFNAVAMMDTLKIHELAAICCMSERNFLRYFRKYFGCSPSTYKKILRFRTALDSQYSKNTNSYNSFLIAEDYYDSSHFRKEFVQFTGSAPRQFKKASFLPGNGSAVFKLM